jgi:hypothetical protein
VGRFEDLLESSKAADKGKFRNHSQHQLRLIILISLGFSLSLWLVSPGFILLSVLLLSAAILYGLREHLG